MFRNTVIVLATVLSVVALAVPSLASDPSAPPKFENLMKTKLQRVEGTEVIVSRVSIAPNAALPKHWHPGEEFVYILSGEVTLLQDGKNDVLGKAGEVVSVPLKQIHSAKAGRDGAVVLVFRVHEAGKAERVMVK